MFRRFALPAAILAAAALFAVPATLHAEEEEAAGTEMTPALNTFSLMDYLFDPPFAVLEEVMESEPEDRRGWRDIRRSSETLAEVTNLLYIRDDLDYADTDEWKEAVAEMRTAADALAESTRTQDFEIARESFIALVQSCNACHDRFEPDMAPKFPVPGE